MTKPLFNLDVIEYQIPRLTVTIGVAHIVDTSQTVLQIVDHMFGEIISGVDIP